MLATLRLVKKILHTIYPTNNRIIKTMTAVIRKQSKSHINAIFNSSKFNRFLKNRSIKQNKPKHTLTQLPNRPHVNAADDCSYHIKQICRPSPLKKFFPDKTQN